VASGLAGSDAEPGWLGEAKGKQAGGGSGGTADRGGAADRWTTDSGTSAVAGGLWAPAFAWRYCSTFSL